MASLMLLIVLLATASLALADDTTRAPKQLAAPRVDWSHARHAYGVIERWVAAGNADTPSSRAPESPEPPESSEPIHVTGVTGVRVTLRWAGLTAGVGDDYIDQKSVRAGEAVDLLASAHAATKRALAAVEQTLDRMRQQAQVNGSPAPSGPAAGLRQVGPKLTVDLQVALRLDPIHLPEDAPPTAIFDRFAPGFHGLRMTRSTTTGEFAQAWTWPASAIAANITPRSQLIELLAGVGYDLARFKMIGRPNGPALERFEVLHLTRPSLQAPIVQLVRGNVVLPPMSISSQMLRGLIERLADNLQHRIAPDGTVAGAYQPTTDQFDPPLASDEESALAAYTLTRWAEQRPALPPGKPDKRGAQAGAAVGKIADRLAAKLHATDDPLDPAASALLLMTVVDSPSLGRHKADRDLIGRQLSAMRWRDGTYRIAGKSGGGGAVNATTGALLTAALSELFEQTRDPDLGRKVRESRDALWANNKPERMVGALPWLMIVENHRVILDQIEDDRSATQPARSTAGEQAARLRSLMVTLRQNQIIDPPALGPADVVGGFELDNSSPDAPPNPDWRSAYVVGFLAAATRQPGVVKDSDRLDWLLTCALGERFLAQLTFDGPACFYVRSPEDAMGGVRLALWDNRLAAAPTAMALLASLELERTMEIVAARPATTGRP